MTVAALPRDVPVGTVWAYLGLIGELPDDWLLLNGERFSATEYPKLDELMRNTNAWGTQDSDILLPDARQKFINADANDLASDGGTVDHDHGAHSAHASQGAHTHDAHTTANNIANPPSISALGNAGTHTSDGAHTHDAHSAHDAQNPAFLTVHWVVKAR